MVVKPVGYRWLWVDMFCIVDNAKVKHGQISRMDVVYKCAAFTIIAAFGDGGNSGLPGISQVHGKLQPQTSIGKLTYMSTLPALNEMV